MVGNFAVGFCLGHVYSASFEYSVGGRWFVKSLVYKNFYKNADLPMRVQKKAYLSHRDLLPARHCLVWWEHSLFSTNNTEVLNLKRVLAGKHRKSQAHRYSIGSIFSIDSLFVWETFRAKEEGLELLLLTTNFTDFTN